MDKSGDLAGQFILFVWMQFEICPECVETDQMIPRVAVLNAVEPGTGSSHSKLKMTLKFSSCSFVRIIVFPVNFYSEYRTAPL
mgnify:CR=1 FL=1